MLTRPLNPELQEKAETELNETPDRIEEDFQQIREWISKQPHLQSRTDDQWLITFLRGCKYSVQRTKEKLDYFYTLRSLVPEFFENRDPFAPEVQEILKSGFLLPLPKTADPAAPRLVIMRWGNCDPEKMPFLLLNKVYFMFMDILMNEDDNCIVSGVSVLVDMSNFSSSFILQCTPAAVKKSMSCLERAYPIRLKRVDFTNSPSIFDKIYNIMKLFLSEKLRSRFEVHRDEGNDLVYQMFPKYLLPKEYGGETSSIDELSTIWKQKLESYRDWFVEDSQFRSHEELRLGSPKTTADLFGVEGTFRKLAVD